MSFFAPIPEPTPKAARHIGFLNYNRRALTLGALTVCGVFSSIQSLPASAEVVKEETMESQLQTYVAPAGIELDPIVRDTFGVTMYSVVQWPVARSTPISSGWGPRSCVGCSAFHRGIDFVPGAGYPIEAVADGVVTEAQSSYDGLGVHVIIEHKIDGTTYSSLYGHMEYGSISVHVGERIHRGQVLGRVGSTGHSTGPHLHFGVLVNGVEINPLPWLRKYANA
ncbi:MAG: M23 family metallopeptidase [Salinibacterium sp.]|nr:MAG: M23 family metallopeptidase [Salinibacterium sp.]